MLLSDIRWSNYSNFCAAILHANLVFTAAFSASCERTRRQVERCSRRSNLQKYRCPNSPSFGYALPNRRRVPIFATTSRCLRSAICNWASTISATTFCSPTELLRTCDSICRVTSVVLAKWKACSRWTCPQLRAQTLFRLRKSLRRRVKPGLRTLKTVLLSIHQAILTRAKARGQSFDRCAGAFGGVEVHPDGIASAIFADSRAVSHEVEVAGRSAARQDGADAGTGLGLPGWKENHHAASRARRSSGCCAKSKKKHWRATRRSLLGELPVDSYRLFLNPLILTEDGRDDYLCAEHYYMFGNFDRDPTASRYFASLRWLSCVNLATETA